MSQAKSHGTVYRALAADGSVLYVGMTTRLAERLKEHERRQPAWWALHARIERDPFLPIAEALKSEADQIELLKPAFNRAGGIAERFGPDSTTEAQALEWKAAYERGATIEQIALDQHVNTQTVRRHLLAVGTEMRRPGQRPGTQRLNVAKAKPKPRPSNVVHVAFKGTRGVHRRRGKRAA